jgi:hypothetical protein
MNPRDRFPEPRDPTSTMVALRAKLLDVCGLDGLEGVVRPESNIRALLKRLSV